MSSEPSIDSNHQDANNTSANAETLRRFSAAWANGDLDTLMSLMTENPTYRASAGAGPGAVYRGRDEVRAAFSRMLGGAPQGATLPALPPGEVAFFGNRALAFWKLHGRAPDGSPAIVEGVDVMTFDGRGRIAVKDAYRKSW
jgi:hypothetical protein